MSRSILDIPHDVLSSELKKQVTAEELSRILEEQPERLLSWEPVLPVLKRLPFQRSNSLILFNVVLSR